MKLSESQQALLKKLPGVDKILETVKVDMDFMQAPKSIVIDSVRQTIDELRSLILSGTQVVEQQNLDDEAVIEKSRQRVKQRQSPNLLPVINATGVVVHTNLGRSNLCRSALDNLTLIAGGYSNLEFDLAQGKRGERYRAVEDLLMEISGAEAALAVNNNAGAVLLSLDTLAYRRQVIVSRGELVEIGGSFRIPDVMSKSGCTLCEVGTTNRTHLKDYESAINSDTALLLKVHQSNFSIVGFTSSVSLAELAELGKKYQVPVMEDLGSGTFIDFSQYGMIKEPTVQESIVAGADVVTFSGDKMLGGPQAGIIVGKRRYIQEIKKNPLTRALRIDKLTLAALESTLRLYREPETAIREIPTLAMIMQDIEEIDFKANVLAAALNMLDYPQLKVQLTDNVSRVGGGALPLQKLPTRCVSVVIQGISANTIDTMLRQHNPPIIGRIEQDEYIIDLRTVENQDIQTISVGFDKLMKRSFT